MTQINQPTYNAVRINISKPAVNVSPSKEVEKNNGIYNSVDIHIDEPNVTSKSDIYNYPESKEMVTSNMLGFNKIPVTYPITYQTTNVIVPKTINSEIEFEIKNDIEDAEVIDEIELKETSEEINIPEANYTTLELENVEPEYSALYYEAIEIPVENDDIDSKDEIKSDELSFKANTMDNIQTPEIIPSKELKPEVDIPLVVSNLSNKNFDVQAQQMEEIARVSLDNPQNAIPFIVRDVFANLIDIIKKDTTTLEAPSEKQINARRKLIANAIILDKAKLNNSEKDVKLPYSISEEEVAMAMEISPMEQAERNKEYALYTIAILSKVYTDEIEKHTGNVVPLTDIPGTSAIVDALRYNPNSGVKVAAIDALKYIQRPEYKEELTTLFTIAQADQNPEVSISATRALSKMN